MAAINYNTLFTRLGAIGHVPYALASAQAAVPTNLTSLWGDYEGTTDDDLIGSLLSVKDFLPQSVQTVASQIAPLAQTTLLRMVQASVPAVQTYQAALIELIRQMTVDSQSVAACTVGVSSSALTSNIGTGTLVTSTKRGDGLIQQNIVAEQLRLACTSDSYTGGAVAGQEPFQIAGPTQTAGLWDYNYPVGSGASTGATAVSADEQASSTTNTTTNGNMETWTTDVPPHLSNWTMSGTWGTEMQQSTTAYRGTYSLQINAGNTANIYQGFNDSTNGTGVSLTPLYSYAVYFRTRAVAGTVTGGVLTVELVDGSGTVVNDQQGVANSFTVTLNTLTTAWVAETGLFRVPNVPPSTMRLRFRVSTTLTGDNVLIDDVCFAPLTAAYSGGFGFVLFSSVTPFVKNDGWDVTATNNRGGQSYLGTFQALFDRFFGMRNLNLLLPYSGSPTQADTKITT